MGDMFAFSHSRSGSPRYCRQRLYWPGGSFQGESLPLLILKNRWNYPAPSTDFFTKPSRGWRVFSATLWGQQCLLFFLESIRHPSWPACTCVFFFLQDLLPSGESLLHTAAWFGGPGSGGFDYSTWILSSNRVASFCGAGCCGFQPEVP